MCMSILEEESSQQSDTDTASIATKTLVSTAPPERLGAWSIRACDARRCLEPSLCLYLSEISECGKETSLYLYRSKTNTLEAQ
jgi:hypothetical protein